MNLQQMILVVEDNLGDAQLIKYTLSDYGYPGSVIHIENGEETVPTLKNYLEKSKEIDCVLLDLNMPRRSGLEILKEIREESNLHHLRVYILSSSDYYKDVEAATALGVSGYYSKPVELMGYTRIWTQILGEPRG